MNEYESEPVRGLPEILPAGERIIWQGAPRWQALAVNAFHVRKAAAYFAAIVAIYVAMSLANGAAARSIAIGVSWQAALALAGIGLLTILAWLYARSTCYTVTDRRIVLRSGVAIPMMVNIPLARIDQAAMRERAGDTGDILFTLVADRRVSYLLMWPNVRPWHFSPVQPMLRNVPAPAIVVDKLAAVLGSGGKAAKTHREADAGDRSGLPARARTAAAL